MRAMLIPGNGGTDPSKEGWYPHVKKELEKIGIEVVAKPMPDPFEAKQKIWLPFIEKEVGSGEDVILIGHSSGAVAIMRYAEQHKVCGLVLVSACHTDLGMPEEAISGYFNRPWQWERIKKNAKWIIQFHSIDDPYIPIEEARHIAEQLKSEYHEYEDQGHLGRDINKMEFHDLVEAVKNRLNLKGSMTEERKGKKPDDILEELEDEETKEQQRGAGGSKKHYKGFKKGFERKFTKYKKKD